MKRSRSNFQIAGNKSKSKALSPQHGQTSSGFYKYSGARKDNSSLRRSYDRSRQSNRNANSLQSRTKENGNSQVFIANVKKSEQLFRDKSQGYYKSPAVNNLMKTTDVFRPTYLNTKPMSLSPHRDDSQIGKKRNPSPGNRQYASNPYLANSKNGGLTNYKYQLMPASSKLSKGKGLSAKGTNSFSQLPSSKKARDNSAHRQNYSGNMIKNMSLDSLRSPTHGPNFNISINSKQKNNNISINIINHSKPISQKLAQQALPMSANKNYLDQTPPHIMKNMDKSNKQTSSSGKPSFTYIIGANHTLDAKKRQMFTENLMKGTSITDKQIKKMKNDKKDYLSQEQIIQQSLKMQQKKPSGFMHNQNHHIQHNMPIMHTKQQNPMHTAPIKTTGIQNLKNKHKLGSRKNSQVESKKSEAESSQRTLILAGLQDVVAKYSIKTRGGFVPNKPSKTNQDTYFIQQHFGQIRNNWYFGVCDGHGINGHFASDHVKIFLPANIELLDQMAVKHSQESELATIKEKKTKEYSLDGAKSEIDECDKKSYLLSQDRRRKYAVISEGFVKTSIDIQRRSFDVNYSGSTVVTVMLSGNKLVCANVGDSRAVLSSLRVREEVEMLYHQPDTSMQIEKIAGESHIPNKVWVSTALSRDHKPDLKDEKDRILASNGRIDPFREPNGDPIGPYRVWLKTENVPGLAMSRSIGDMVASSVGVIPEPELNSDDKFVVIASDGVWEFISNEDICNMVAPFWLQNNPEGAADLIVEKSVEHWKREDEVIDDITCVVIFLNVQ